LLFSSPDCFFLSDSIVERWILRLLITQNCNASVQTTDTTTLPVKRLFDNNNSLNISVKKLKASPYDDQDKDEDHISFLKINKRPGKSADNSFSSLMKKLEL